MTSNADSTAAPSIVPLGGKECRVSPLTIHQLGRFERWAQDRFLAREYAAIAAMPADQRAEARAEAREEAAKVKIGSRPYSESIDSYEGTLEVLAMSLSVEHDDIRTAADVAALTDDIEELQAAATKLAELTFPSSAKGKGGGGSKKKPKPRKRDG